MAVRVNQLPDCAGIEIGKSDKMAAAIAAIPEIAASSDIGVRRSRDGRFLSCFVDMIIFHRDAIAGFAFAKEAGLATIVSFLPMPSRILWRKFVAIDTMRLRSAPHQSFGQ